MFSAITLFRSEAVHSADAPISKQLVFLGLYILLVLGECSNLQSFEHFRSTGPTLYQSSDLFADYPLLTHVHVGSGKSDGFAGSSIGVVAYLDKEKSETDAFHAMENLVDSYGAVDDSEEDNNGNADEDVVVSVHGYLAWIGIVVAVCPYHFEKRYEMIEVRLDQETSK